MSRIVVELPDDKVQAVADWSSLDMERQLDRVERVRRIGERHEEARLRKFVARYLLSAGSIILAVSLGLIVHAALGRSALEASAVATLIGSVAVEFVSMLYLVVRYLFREEQ